MKNLNVAFIIFELGAGGQERQMAYAIKSLVQEGIKPLLFIWNNNKKISQGYGIINSGANVIALKGNFFKKLYKIRSTLIFKKIQVFQSWSILNNITLLLSSFGCNVATIGALRSTLFGIYINKTRPVNSLKIFIQLISVKNIICNSYSALNDMEKMFNKIPFANKRLFVLHNRTKINYLDDFDLSKKKYNSVSCSSLLALKKIDFIIDIVKVLKNYYPNYVHAHAGGNGDMHDKLFKKIESNGLEDNFLLLGELNNLDDFYRNGKLYIHSSKYEGTPNTLIEAMSFGLPIITTNWGDANHYVINGRNGYVFNNDNPYLWAEKIRTILSSKAVIDKMVSNSLKIANQKLDLNKLYPDMMKIYSQILHKKI